LRDESKVQERINEYKESALFPLVRAGRYTELCDDIKERLRNEPDSEFRYQLMSELVKFSGLAGREEEGFLWAERLCQEFDDSPFSWSVFAWTYLHRAYRGEASQEELEKALQLCETGLERARAKNEFVRFVLFDMCRVLVFMEDYVRLEKTIRDIVEDLETFREFDSPRIEAEWLQSVPESKLDTALVARFKRLEEADVERTQPLWPEIRPATLDDLEC